MTRWYKRLGVGAASMSIGIWALFSGWGFGADRYQGPLVMAAHACLQHDHHALRALHKAGDQGSYAGVEAMAAYAVCTGDAAAAKPWLVRASNMGSGWASQVLAQYLQNQSPSKARTAAQLTYLLRAALQGNAWAARELSVLYLNGAEGLAPNAQKSSYWAQYAEVVKEIIPNTFYLAESYAKGWGVPKNLEKAKILYGETMTALKQTAAGGDPYADMLFYLAYSKGYGVKKDPAQALHWLQSAAQKGYPKAVAAMAALHIASKDGASDD